MPYSIQTKDGIKINNIPDDIDPQSQVLRDRVASIRQQQQGAKLPEEQPDRTLAGRVQRLKSDFASGRNEREAVQDAIFGSAASVEDVGQFIKGVPGAIPSIVSGAVAEPIAGIAGGIASLTPGLDPGVGARTVERVRNALTIDPIGKSAKNTLGNIGSVLEPLTGLTKKAGEFSQDIGAPPLVATGIETGLAAIPEVLGGGLLSKVSRAKAIKSAEIKSNTRLFDPDTQLPTPEFDKALSKRGLDAGDVIEGDSIPATMGDKTPDQIVDDIIKRKLKIGDNSGALHKFKLNKSGAIVDDDLGIMAARSGFRPGDITSTKSASNATKTEMAKMLQKKRAILVNSSKALDSRPSDIVGDNAMSLFNHIANKADELNSNLDSIVKRGMPTGKNLLEGPETKSGLVGLKIDTSKVSNLYTKNLDKLRITTDKNGKIDFSNSLISEDLTSQAVIRSVTRILKKGGEIDAADAHWVKRQIDTMLDHRKQKSGLSESGKKFASTMRKAVNEAVRDVSPSYAKINDQLSKALDSMDEFDRSLKSIDPESQNANQSVGQTLGRLAGNQASRIELSNSLKKLESVANEFGGDFNVEITRLIQFDNMLDDRFGATATRGLQGSIQSALKSESLKSPIGMAKDAASRFAAEKAKRAFGLDEKSALDVMQKIITRKE